MPRQRKNEVYRDTHGVWWARLNGKRHTLNTAKAHFLLLDVLTDAAQRAAIVRGDEDAPSGRDLEVIILRGIPGSGKSTWAKAYIEENPWFKRISRDCLREMFDYGEYSGGREKFIREMRDRLIRACLEQGQSIIIDDTNLKERDIREITKQAYIYDRPDERWDFRSRVALPVRVVDFETPLEECIARDAQRAHPVGEQRIREMHEQFLHAIGKWEPSGDLREAMRAAIERLDRA